jgi:hypothetical protein
MLHRNMSQTPHDEGLLAAVQNADHATHHDCVDACENVSTTAQSSRGTSPLQTCIRAQATFTVLEMHCHPAGS